jgi:hypothetical protein
MEDKGLTKDSSAQEFTVRLADGDAKILDRFRGDLSREAFISILLRMVDSGAVSRPPDGLKD